MAHIICIACQDRCELNCLNCGANDWQGEATYNSNTSFRKYILRFLSCKNRHCAYPVGDMATICPRGYDIYRADFSITGDGVTLKWETV